MGFLEVLKIIGIVIGGLILFIIVAIAVILASPIFYKGKITYKDDLYIRIKVCHIFRFVYGFLYYENDNLDYYVRVLWEKIDDDEDEATKRKRKIKKAKKKAKKRKKRLQRAGVNAEAVKPVMPSVADTDAIKPEITEKTENYTDNQKTSSKVHKKSIFKRLKSLYNVIKQKIIYYINNLKEIMTQIRDKDNREAVVYALKKIKQPVSFVINNKLKIRMKFGTDDPAKTGEILGISYAAAALLGVDLVIEPDFENKIFELDAGFKGHVSIFKVIIWLLELYSNERIQVVVDEIL